MSDLPGLRNDSRPARKRKSTLSILDDGLLVLGAVVGGLLLLNFFGAIVAGVWFLLKVAAAAAVVYVLLRMLRSRVR